MEKIPITVVILTLNDEPHLPELLDSIQPYVEDIFIVDIIRPSNRNMRTICLSDAPRLRSVTTSSFLSMISIDNEPMILKQATIRMNVRKMYAISFSIFIILKVSSCCSKRSFTTNLSAQSCLICDFTLSKLLPGFSLSSSDDNIPC